MNKNRRTRINAIVSQLESLAAALDDLMTEEQDALDGLPDSLKNGDKGTYMELCVDRLTSARDAVENAASELSEITER